MLNTYNFSSFGEDIVKVANIEGDEVEIGLDLVSVAISAAVTACGGIHVSKLKMNVMKMGDNIYHYNMDSLLPDIMLPESMVSWSELKHIF